MTNVLNPPSDLKALFIKLLQDLKPSDWQKPTEFNKLEVSILIKELLNLHSVKSEVFNTEVLNPNISKQPIDSFLLKEIECFKSELHTLPIVEDIQVNMTQNYTRCWLLQQYIRQVINNHALLEQKFYSPFLNYTMASLPSHYSNSQAKVGEKIKIEIVGDAGGVWIIERTPLDWKFANAEEQVFTATVYLDQQIAWLLFSNALHVSEIGQYYQIIGDKNLGSHFLGLRV